MYITGLYHRFIKFLILHFLYAFVLKILSFNLGKPDTISTALSRKLLANFSPAPPRYTHDCLEDELPPANPYTPLYYLDILKREQAKGHVIKPIKHQKPIPKNLTCPSCLAPYHFIYSNAPVHSKQNHKTIQKYRCKICSRQWLLHRARQSPVFLCPFCQYTLKLWITRSEFDKFKCQNPKCPYLLQHDHHYVYRDYFFDLYKLQLASPGKPLVDLSRTHYAPSVVGLALTLNVNYGLPYRMTAQFFKDLLGLPLSHSTIYTWTRSIASLLEPLACHIPLSTSNLLVIDETYERYAGCWGYYYATLDAINRYVIAPHFSAKRNVTAATTALIGALKRIKSPPPRLYIVHDCFAPYFLAIQLINQSNLFPFTLKSLPVKGLKDPPFTSNPYRRFKNIIERYFGTAKPAYYDTRGFGSFSGAVAHNILRAIHYNYFRPHQLFSQQPPLSLDGLLSSNPIEKWNRLISIATAL